jgi:hypothetical protein
MRLREQGQLGTTLYLNTSGRVDISTVVVSYSLGWEWSHGASKRSSHERPIGNGDARRAAVTPDAKAQR